MKTEKIQEEIEDAVRIFRETLEKSYLTGKKEFHGIGVHWLTNILCGKVSFQRLKNGNLKITGELDKSMFNEGCEGLPKSMADYDIFPLVITLFNKDIGEKQNES